MITIKTTRDQARIIEQQFFPYMILLAAGKMRNNAGHQSKYITSMMLHSLLIKMELAFNKKLLTDAANLSFKMERHYAIALFYALMRLPIDEKLVYNINLRQRLCDGLHSQLFVTVPGEKILQQS